MLNPFGISAVKGAYDFFTIDSFLPYRDLDCQHIHIDRNRLSVTFHIINSSFK